MKIRLFRKTIIFLLSAIILVINYIFPELALADYTVSVQEVQTSNIANGVTYEKHSLITDRGWLRYYIVKANMKDSGLHLDVLYSGQGISHRDTVMGMINNGSGASSNVLAAVNGDFFNMEDICDTIGAAVSQNSVISTPNNTLKYATFYIDANAQYAIDNLKNNVKLVAPNGKSEKLFGINKKYRGYTDISMLTSAWGPKSPGAAVEMIVKNNKVVKINSNSNTGKFGDPKKGVAIPDKNTYVFVSSDYKNNFMKTNFKVGDTVKIAYDFGNGISGDSLKLALGGKNILLKNGQITNDAKADSFFINAATAVGFNSNKDLIFFAVDGRETSSAGMNMNEIAKIMKDNGATDAISLDGGGSTTLITKQMGEGCETLMNDPADGSMRKVADGLGLFSSYKTNNLYGISLKTDYTLNYNNAVVNNMFKENGRNVYISGFDEHNNPIYVEPSKITWKVSGVKGKVINSRFIALESGKATVTASYKGKSAQIQFNVIEKPVSVSTVNNNMIGMTPDGESITIEKGDQYLYKNLKNSAFSDYQNKTLDDLAGIIKSSSPNNANDHFAFSVYSDGSGITPADVDLINSYGSSVITGAIPKINLHSPLNKMASNIFSFPEQDYLQYKNSLFLRLKDNDYGVTGYDYKQWKLFADTLNNKKGKNLFVLLDKPFNSSGFNKEDTNYLKSKLMEYKYNNNSNVYVISFNANETKEYSEDGIRFIQTNPNDNKNVPIVYVSKDNTYYSMIKK